MKKIKKFLIKKLPIFVFNTKKYYPPIIDVNLLVCSWDCKGVSLGTAKFKHICDYCNKEMKTHYHLQYEAIDKSKVNKIGYLYKTKALGDSLKAYLCAFYSTVTLFARFRGLSTSRPFSTVVWYARSCNGMTVTDGERFFNVSGI